MEGYIFFGIIFFIILSVANQNIEVKKDENGDININEKDKNQLHLFSHVVEETKQGFKIRKK
ncbi:MAG TPA: hypothetical protein ENK58_05325 [Desulfobacterales bacterium]|nr:hypothetical protein [Desulfobacterales bacterium]